VTLTKILTDNEVDDKNLYSIYSYDRRTLLKAGIINLGLIELSLDN
jgi:hypothetical protein